MVPLFYISKPILNFQTVKRFLFLCFCIFVFLCFCIFVFLCFCVSCSSSASCYFECLCNFVLTNCSRIVKRIKVLSRFLSLFLPVEIIRVIWYFVICSELCSIVLEIQISIRKKIRIKYGTLFSSQNHISEFVFFFCCSIPGRLIF